jgi:hypothetical protein
MFFDLQITPEELARRKYGQTRSTPVSAKRAPKPPLKEIIRRGPFALVWVNPNPPPKDNDRDGDNDIA